MRIYKEKRIFQKYTNFFLDFRCTFFHKCTFLVCTYFSEVVRIFEILVPFSFDFFLCKYISEKVFLKCVHLFLYAYFFHVRVLFSYSCLSIFLYTIYLSNFFVSYFDTCSMQELNYEMFE